MGKIFLAVWLALFAAQSSDVIAVVAPDDCVEDTSQSGTDPCPDRCARCVCCARVPMFVPGAVPAFASQRVATVTPPAPIVPLTSAEPHGIFHVPKSR